MSKSANVCICGLLLVLGWSLHARLQGQSSPPPAPTVDAQSAVPPSASAAIDARAVVKRYCVSCHNQRLKTGGLTLDLMDVDRVGEHAASWEKVVRKLRAGSMPPLGLPRPDATTVETVATTLEAALDRAAAETPNPGSPTIHRLNRSEYANAIRDLVALEIDGREMLPLMMRISASITWPTSSQPRPPSSIAPLWPPERLAGSRSAIRRSLLAPRRTSSRRCGFRTTAWTRNCRLDHAAALRFATTSRSMPTTW